MLEIEFVCQEIVFKIFISKRNFEKRSPVWEYFTEKDGAAFCKLCPASNVSRKVELAKDSKFLESLYLKGLENSLSFLRWFKAQRRSCYRI